MKYSELKEIINCDLYRAAGCSSFAALLKQFFFGESFKYIFWMRVTNYLSKKNVLMKPFFVLSYFILKHYRYKFGIYLPYKTKVGKGFYIGHFGGIVINEHCVIGENCNISHCVTLGVANRGSKKGFPEIGNKVYLAPGVKIIGAVKIGNNAAVGANCVVTKDLPDNAVAVGIPAKIISYEGSSGYINRIKPN